MFSHFPIDSLRGMDTAFKWDIMQNADFAVAGATPFENGRLGHKTWTDVNGFADFWSWFNLGVVSLFWPMGWEFNEVTGNASLREALDSFGWEDRAITNVSQAGRMSTVTDCSGLLGDTATSLCRDSVDGQYLPHNIIVGGARMRQERGTAVDCAPRGMANLLKGTCLDHKLYYLTLEPHRGLGMNLEKVPKLTVKEAFVFSPSALGHLATHVGAVIVFFAAAVSFGHSVKASEPLVPCSS